MKLFKSLAAALKSPQEVAALKLSLNGSLPKEIFDFPYLKELYLEGHCTDFAVPAHALSELKILSIKCENFAGDTADFFRLKNLENLKIIETPIKRFLLPLGSSIAPLKSLTLKSCGLESLPEEIGLLNGLTELNLQGNNLSTLPHSFVDLVRLRRLNLDQNSFSQFPDLVGNMRALSHLSIDGNKFSEDEKARIQRQFHITPV